jgi:DNA-binding LacI/PurR family transcriptional regulator
VLIGFPADAGGLTCVDLDFHAAGGRCVEHLAGLGHHRLALLGAPPVVYERDTGFAHRTRAGFLEAAERLGLVASARACGESLPEVRAVIAELFSGDPGITGLVVHNEAAVAPVLAELARMGRRVPDDVSVVAICPDQVAMSAVPPLSSVLIPAEEVGRQAVGLLMRKLGGSAVPEATLLIPALTERQSTRRPVNLTA